MSHPESFDSFYDEKLAPSLQVMSSKVKDISSWGLALLLLVLCCTLFLILGYGILAVCVLMGAAISAIIFFKKKNDYVNSYKETIIKEIVNFLNPGATYKPREMLDSSEYENSGLYPKMYNNYWGEDLVEGVYKNVKYYCSEIETSYRSTGGRSFTKLLFRGLFFTAEIKNTFSSVYVWPANDVQLPVSIADYHFERFLPLPDITPVSMQNEEFEKSFTVYAEDDASAKAIITEEMMSRMIAFKKQIDRDVRFSFIQNNCYVAIAIPDNLLEPSFPHPENKERIKEYFFSVLLILSIINQLDLQSLQ